MRAYVFLGPPGAGKGTMASMLSEAHGLAHISTGDILRREIRKHSDLGAQAKAYMEPGQLVPDNVVASIVEQTLAAEKIRRSGFILDGYPRTVRQAELLDESLGRQAMHIDAVVLLDADRELLKRRLSARRVCTGCGAVFNVLFGPPKTEGVCDHCAGELAQRDDDRPETIEQRLEVYDRQTAPLIEFYERRGNLRRVDASGSREANLAALRQVLELDA